MKTTLDIRDDLISKAKALAARERTSLTRIIEEALALRLRRARTPVVALTDLPVSRHSGGVREGIDPASNRSLLEAAGE